MNYCKNCERPLEMKTKLIDFLCEKGFKIISPVYDECELLLSNTLAITGPDCECNDRPPCLIAKISVIDRFVGVTYRIRGEINGVWSDFSVYSLTENEAIDRYDDVVKMLTAAWAAVEK